MTIDTIYGFPWLLKYAGCETFGEGCMGPAATWYLFNTPVWVYPYILIVSATLSAFLYMSYHLVMVRSGRRKAVKGYLFREKWKEVAKLFLVLVLAQMMLFWWVADRFVY